MLISHRNTVSWFSLMLCQKIRKSIVALQWNRVTFWKFRHLLILAYGTWRWQESTDPETGHCYMDPQRHSFLHFILKPTKKEIGKGMGLFNSGGIKTKLLTLPLLWAYRSTTKCTLHHLGVGIWRETNFNLTKSPELYKKLITKSRGLCFRLIIKPRTSLCS